MPPGPGLVLLPARFDGYEHVVQGSVLLGSPKSKTTVRGEKNILRQRVWAEDPRSSPAFQTLQPQGR